MDKRTVSVGVSVDDFAKRVKAGSVLASISDLLESPMDSTPYYSGYGNPDSAEIIPDPPAQESEPSTPTMHIHVGDTNTGSSPDPIRHVLSSTTEEFSNYYELREELGRGAFSVVRKCVDKQTNELYAVKIIDLRPLRLRENFNPSRLKREVDIMKRLHHPNIIDFVNVFESSDQLLVVMEYAPGTELFDVILAKKRYSEDDARVVFGQVARALYYLHSSNIIHRDIKPENILVLDRVDPRTGQPVVKLLDFGLSKMIGTELGSAARTFVGTPCYLAPEVEMAAHGRGGSYGTPVDCWSIGAVLYVMLVARFPEFITDNNGTLVVNLSTPIWAGVSEDAKSLIRGLMNPDPTTRLTMREALQHKWLGQYRATDEELSIHVPSNPVTLDRADRRVSVGPSVASLEQKPENGALVVLPDVALLLQLQRTIAKCFENVHEAYIAYPPVASEVRKGAMLCRVQLVESMKLMRTVEFTATSVLNLFPDLALAVEDGEPQLAVDFFNLVKDWVAELRQQLHAAQETNRQSMQQIQDIVEGSALAIQAMHQGTRITYPTAGNSISNRLLTNGPASSPTPSEARKRTASSEENEGLTDAVKRLRQAARDQRELTADQVQDLFMHLFSDIPPQRAVERVPHSTPNSVETTPSKEAMSEPRSPDINVKPVSTPRTEDAEPVPMDRSFTNDFPEDLAYKELRSALTKLHEVDRIFGQLGMLWANTEVVLEVLTKKGEHIEKFISFAHKPRLLQRFHERLDDYRRYWENIKQTCMHYVTGAGQQPQRYYRFLDQSNQRSYDMKGSDEAPSTIDLDRFDSL